MEVRKREENSGLGSWGMMVPSSEMGTQKEWRQESRFESVESECPRILASCLQELGAVSP